MAQRAIIEVVARYKDEAGKGLKETAKNAEKAKEKLVEVAGAAAKLGKQKAKVILDAEDRASSKILKAMDKAKSFASKTYSAAVELKDKITAPLKRIKDSLFSIKSLVMTIGGLFAANKLISSPLAVADAYSGTKIGFSTLLGDAKGQQMMDEMDLFAKKTPFKTSNVINNAQKMMAYGWDAERILTDMETIGNAAAATGKMDQGLESIVYALSEIRTKGKLSTQELNQLASAGIKAKLYLAEGLGYGTSDEGMMKLAADLEKGAIGANQAIELILQGMKEFDGMMDRTANETVSGLKAQLEDVFEINIQRRWGQGLQAGVREGLLSIVELLDASEDGLARFGDTLYQVGKTASEWFADKVKGATSRVMELMDTSEFQNASIGGKAMMIWDAAIGDPFSSWWENKGRKLVSEKAAEFGESLGTGISASLLALLGVDVATIGTEGASVGASFARGFAEGFDGSAITKALAGAIADVWSALPVWAKVLVGGYAAGKAGGLITAIGSTGNAMVGGSGILGGLASAGYAMTGGAAGSALAGGTAAGVGAAGIVGGVAALKGIYDLYSGYRATQRGDEVGAKASAASGVTTLSGVGVGALIGTAIAPGIGTAIGAGIGGLAGMFGGGKLAEKIRKDARKEAGEISEELQQAAANNMRDMFGDVYMSLDEISTIAEKITFGDKVNEMQQFATAITAAESSFSSLQMSAESLDRWLWKGGLGIKFNQDEAEAFGESVISYLDAAQQYVESKHYEFTAAVSLLIDPESESGKGILDGGNSFYASLQEKISSMGEELTGKVNIALQDGVIDLNEEAELTNLQNQIAEVTNKLAQAQAEAEFEAIKIKFGEGRLDAESFANLQTELQAKMDEATGNYDNALTASITSLKLQLSEEAITQEQYDAQVKALTDSYHANIDSISASVSNIQLELIGEAYGDVLGEDSKSKLTSALEESLRQGINPATWTTADAQKFLNTPGLEENAATALSTMLSNVANTFQTTLDSTFNKTFNTSATISISPNVVLARRTATLTASGAATGSSTVNFSIGNNAAGGIVGGRMLSWLGEEGPEAVIPLGSKHRSRAIGLFQKAGEALGVSGGGGTTIDVGGVTIQVSGGGNVAADIENQKEEIAEQIAAIFNRVISAQYENMPARGGA